MDQAAERTCVFRFDASPRIGTGHLRRSLCLARHLKELGATIHVIGDITPDSLRQHGAGIVDEWLPADPADAEHLVRHATEAGAVAIVLDTYRVDESYQQAVLASDIPWLQFEGMPGQRLWADWIVAASPAARPDIYRPLCQRPSTTLLLGPEYAILRPEFLPLRRSAPGAGEVAQLVMTFGGGDDRGAALAALNAWQALPRRPRVTVLTTSANPRAETIRRWASEAGDGKVQVLVDSRDYPDILAAADLAIIAGGTTLYETAYLGVPALVIRIAPDQHTNVAAWRAMGAVVDAGDIGTLIAGELAATLQALIADGTRRERLASTGMARVDGHGARRIAEALWEAPPTRNNRRKDT